VVANLVTGSADPLPHWECQTPVQNAPIPLSSSSVDGDESGEAKHPPRGRVPKEGKAPGKGGKAHSKGGKADSRGGSRQGRDGTQQVRKDCPQGRQAALQAQHQFRRLGL